MMKTVMTVGRVSDTLGVVGRSKWENPPVWIKKFMNMNYFVERFL